MKDRTYQAMTIQEQTVHTYVTLRLTSEIIQWSDMESWIRESEVP